MKQKIIPNASQIFTSAKKGAIKRGIPFSLTIKDIEAIVFYSNNKCMLSGIEFYKDLSFKGKQPFVPSLDRIDSNKGYIKGNVRLVCVVVNNALHTWGDEVFDYMCEAYSMHKRNKNIEFNFSLITLCNTFRLKGPFVLDLIKRGVLVENIHFIKATGIDLYFGERQKFSSETGEYIKSIQNEKAQKEI